MKPRQTLAIASGRLARSLARLRGGGSALPGLVVEKLDPTFLASVLGQLPYGVVLVSGTNGKTTTTKMVSDLLKGQGLRVFTNPTGSNFTRGVAASLLTEVSLSGRLDADVAVLELDEAHAVHFVATVKPRVSLLLNVMRDQLDRFGEIDHTARLLGAIAAQTTGTVVLNREDPLVSALSSQTGPDRAVFFGLGDDLVSHFPSDDVLYGGASAATQKPEALVSLQAYDDDGAVFRFTGSDQTPEVRTPLRLNGIYNVFNAAAALATAEVVLGDDLDRTALIDSLAAVTPAFGRGESLEVGGRPLELVLVKNPGGFRLGLQSFSAEGWSTMIAINDNYADGRDMSWLWDVDFSTLVDGGVSVVSGSRAPDMAPRLDYDDVAVNTVELDLGRALALFIAAHPDSPKRIFCTYTAMLALRRHLSRVTDVQEVGIGG